MNTHEIYFDVEVTSVEKHGHEEDLIKVSGPVIGANNLPVQLDIKVPRGSVSVRDTLAVSIAKKESP